MLWYNKGIVMVSEIYQVFIKYVVV